MKQHFLFLLFALFAALYSASPTFVLGSGTYTARPPKPPSSIDASKYQLGKNVFAGKTISNENSSQLANHQEGRLKELQAKLPKAAQGSVNLPEKAGRISASQMEALEYYLQIRYKIK